MIPEQVSQVAATLTGSGGLSKAGNGRLILSGNNSSWTGNTLVEKGTLLVTAADALGSPSYPTKVGSGATLELSGGITVPEPIDLLGGKLVSTSGDNTLVNRLLLVGSSTLEVQKDSITLNPSSGDAVAVDSGSAAFNSNLTVAGDGDLVVGTLDLQDQSTPRLVIAPYRWGFAVSKIFCWSIGLRQLVVAPFGWTSRGIVSAVGSALSTVFSITDRFRRTSTKP